METGPRDSLLTLDLVRGLAAVEVLLAHARGFSWVDYGSLPADQQTVLVASFFALTRLADEAVMVFFVLSGFLVGGKVIERVRAGTFDLRAYAVDRSTRVLLPLVPACLLAAAIGAAFYGQAPNVVQLLGNMIGLQGLLVPSLPLNSPLWSLAFEIWFYIAAGVLGALFTRGPGPALLAAVAVLLLVFASLGSPYLIFWVGGALMALATGLRRAGAVAIVGAALFVGGVITNQLGSDSKSFEGIDLPPHLGQALLCGGFCLCLPWLCRPGPNRALTPAATAIGGLSAFSYTLYLTHYPLIAVLGLSMTAAPTLSAASLGAFVLKVAACLGLAVAFYWAFERHTGALRRLVNGAMRTAAAPSRA